jgi:hypothetical protein
MDVSETTTSALPDTELQRIFVQRRARRRIAAAVAFIAFLGVGWVATGTVNTLAVVASEWCDYCGFELRAQPTMNLNL